MLRPHVWQKRRALGPAFSHSRGRTGLGRLVEPRALSSILGMWWPVQAPMGERMSSHRIKRLTSRLRGEAGFALPVTLLMLLAAFATVSVGVVTSVRVQRG